MEYGIVTIVITAAILGLEEISSLKKRLASQEKRLSELAKLSGHDYLALNGVSDEIKELALHLKGTGEKIKAVKLIREHTQMSVIEAKKYIDELN